MPINPRKIHIEERSKSHAAWHLSVGVVVVLAAGRLALTTVLVNDGARA